MSDICAKMVATLNAKVVRIPGQTQRKQYFALPGAELERSMPEEFGAYISQGAAIW